MFRINLPISAYLCAALLTATCILGQHEQQLYRNKPWPTYSLQNMPQTRFTCHDKILGGYYADSETQCQMFHVCVKVAGVGVQDFRFLCPNGTAFDQEAQICADWGDVDCEQSVLYYGSDNFDLYRIGSGFESKRAPLAEEEEATFHLQRAESADIRRSKETRVDQKSRPDQPPNYTKHFEAPTRSNALNTYEQQQQQQQHRFDVTPKRPISSYYTPTTTSTTSTTTERSNDEAKQDFDDIFKGSHSSNFFANRNGGREDDLLDHPITSKLNDFTEYYKKNTAETSTNGKSRSQPTRSKRIKTTTTTTVTTPSTTTTGARPLSKSTKKITSQTSFGTEFGADLLEVHKSAASTSTPASTSTAATTSRPTYSSVNRFSISSSDNYQTQQNIQPTTYNPGLSIYRVKSTTPKYADFNRDHTTSSHQQQFGRTNNYNSKPTVSVRKSQKLEHRTENKVAPHETNNANTTSFGNLNEFNELSEFTKAKTSQQPQPFRTTPPAQKLAEKTTIAGKNVDGTARDNNNKKYYHARGHNSGFGSEDPSPFSAPQRQRGSSNGNGNANNKSKTLQNITNFTDGVNHELKPRGFTNRGSINYKATTQRVADDFYSSTAHGAKKFSTLVPKDQYVPTTFKPTTYNKPFDNNHYLTQQTVRPSNRPQISALTSAASTQSSTTANPYYNPSEDDGQYHPELYEIDFPRNRFNLQRSSTKTVAGASASATTSITSTTRKPFSYNTSNNHNTNFQNPQNHLKSQQQTAFQKEHTKISSDDSNDDEDELFNTAHSLNFGAASINKLRADIIKAEKTSQQYNSQYSPNILTLSISDSTPNTTPTSTTSFSYHPTTIYSTASAAGETTTTTTTAPTTTKRFITTLPNSTTTTPPNIFSYDVTKSSNSKTNIKSAKLSKGKGKKASSSSKSSSKRPSHADEDTSYDYAYYDSDTLSETPQEYSEYEIAEFSRTRKN